MRKNVKSTNNVIDLPTKKSVSMQIEMPSPEQEFLNQGIHSRGQTFVSVDMAAMYARSAGIKTSRDWFKFHQNNMKPDEIPADPAIFYSRHNVWPGWPTFLATKNFRGVFNTPEALKKVKDWFTANDVKTVTQFLQMQKEGLVPDYVPSAPNTTFGLSFKEFLVPNPVESKYMSYDAAKAVVQKWKCKDYLEYRKVRKNKAQSEPQYARIPGSPDRVYRELGWEGWASFLG